MHTQCGIGQGDVFSCILYTIFINSLHSYLKSVGAGITPYPGVRLVASGFVDDVAALSNSLAMAETTARAVEKWGLMFGHQLQLARNKTAILHLPPPNSVKKFYRQVNTLHPSEEIPTIARTATLADGSVVPFTPSYKYLGYVVHPQLPEGDHLAKLIRYISTNHNRYFAYNGLTRRLSPTAVCQILKTVCTPNYLAALINPTAGNISDLSVALRPLMRTLLSNLPDSTPSIFLNAESNIPSGRYLVTRSILTLLLSLATTTYRDAPLPALIRAQRVSIASGGSIPFTSWLARASLYLHKFVPELGRYSDIAAVLHLPPGRVITPSDATLAAAVYARMVCAVVARDELLKLVRQGKLTRNVTSFSHTPAPGPPNQAYYDLCYGFKYIFPGVSYPSKNVPLSCACTELSSALTARVTAPLSRGLLLAIRSARLGACAMHYWPLAPPSWVITEGRTGEHFRNIARGTACPFCPTEIADPRHVLCDCAHPAATAARADILSSAESFIPVLALHILKASPVPSAALTNAYDDLLALPHPDWASASGKSHLHRLALALPWPEVCVDDHDIAHARLLGRLMDLTIVRNSSLHPIANSWVAWAAKALMKACGAWASAVEDNAPPPV